MKNKKLAVLLSALVLTTAPAAVLATACDTTPENPPVDQTTDYTFSFVGGTGATGTAPTSIKKKAEETFTLPANTFVKEGYTFEGWSDGTATTPFAAGATYTAGTANVTFTAVWTAVDYKVSFVGGEDATGTVADITGKHIGDKVTLPENAFEKDDHTFTGWSVNGEPKQAGDEITIGTADVTVTAVWEQTKHEVSFVGGEGATGTVAAIKGLNGDEVTLPENDFEKSGHVFIGWKVGDEIKVAGDKITLGKEDVSVSAVWFKEGGYVDNLGAGITVTFDDGKVTITKVASKWDFAAGGMVDVTLTTKYNYSIAGTVVTFTEPEEESEVVPAAETEAYTGVIFDGVVIITVPVMGAWGADDTSLVLSETALTPIADMGDSEMNGFAQTVDFEDHLYMYDNGLVVMCEGYYDIIAKYGTYTADGNHVYSLKFAGDDKIHSYKISVTEYGVAFYFTDDGFKGEYTFGEETVTLNGFGEWDNGTYIVISDDTHALIYLEDPEELTSTLCTLSENTLTEITNEKAGVYISKSDEAPAKMVVYNGTDFAGVLFEDEGGNVTAKAVAVKEGTASLLIVDNYTSFVVMLMPTGKIMIKSTYRNSSNCFYTLNGAEVAGETIPTVALEAGEYVDSITYGVGTASTRVTAVIESSDETGTVLKLKRGTSAAAEYLVTAGETAGSYTLTQINISSGTPVAATGYVVDGVLFISGIKASTTQVVCALSTTAMERIDNVSNGYVNNPTNSNLKLYLFKNNFAVYYTAYSAAKCGTYTVSGNIYTVTFTDETTGEYKVTLDQGTVKATYVMKDAYAGTQTIGDKSYVFDGFGNYTCGAETGYYAVGSAGLTIVKADGTTTPYTFEDGVYTVAENPVIGETDYAKIHLVSGSSVISALRTKGLIFDQYVEVYMGTGCARITYKVVTGESEDEQISENQTVLVALGCTVEINGVTFTATRINDKGEVTLQFVDGSLTRSVTYSDAAG